MCDDCVDDERKDYQNRIVAAVLHCVSQLCIIISSHIQRVSSCCKWTMFSFVCVYVCVYFLSMVSLPVFSVLGNNSLQVTKLSHVDAQELGKNMPVLFHGQTAYKTPKPGFTFFGLVYFCTY